MSNQATRLAEEAKRWLSNILDATYSDPSEQYERQAKCIDAIDALLALVQPPGHSQRLILETARDLLLAEDTPSKSRRRHAGLALDLILEGKLAEQQPAVSEEWQPGQWWIKELEYLWGGATADGYTPTDPLDVRRAAKVACNFVAATFAARAQSSKGDEGMQHE